jgi:Major Facilitator Superfamily
LRFNCASSKTIGGGGRPSAILVLLSFAMLIVSLDQYIVVVALPDIGRDLGYSAQTLQAVVSTYAIASSGFLLFGGRASDLLGRRRILLIGLHPERQAALDAALIASLAAIPEGEPKVKGLDLGRKAAAEMVALRAKDGADAPESYRPHTSPGVYVPTVVPVFSHFPAVTPWAMTSGSQFRPAVPPALDSEVWTKDVNEIRELGARNSAVRTAEQTTIGRFWLMTGPRSYNPIVRQLPPWPGKRFVSC